MIHDGEDNGHRGCWSKARAFDQQFASLQQLASKKRPDDERY